MTKARRFITLLFTIVIAQLAVSQSIIAFQESGLQSAFNRAKAEKKPVMLWCYTTWCPHCKYMKSQVFTNSSVAEYYNKTFICVAQDIEKGEGIELNKVVKLNSFPTFIFYDPNGKIMYRMEGEFIPAVFITEGKNALISKKQLPYLKEQFEKDVSNSTNCFDYLRALKKGGMDFSSVVTTYFATKTDKQLLSEVNWRIFTNGVTDFNSREFQFVISHQKEYASIASPARVNRKLKYEVKSLLSPLVEATDTINYRTKRELAAQIHSFATDSLIFTYDMQIDELTHNWNGYCKTGLQSTEIYVWNNHTQLSDIATNFLKNVSDPKALSQAVHWAERSLTLDRSYDNYLLCAKLYKQLHNPSAATKLAKNAKELAAKSGWEGVEAQQLLQELDR